MQRARRARPFSWGLVLYQLIECNRVLSNIWSAHRIEGTCELLLSPLPFRSTSVVHSFHVHVNFEMTLRLEGTVRAGEWLIIAVQSDAMFIERAFMLRGEIAQVTLKPAARCVILPDVQIPVRYCLKFPVANGARVLRHVVNEGMLPEPSLARCHVRGSMGTATIYLAARSPCDLSQTLPPRAE